MRLTLWIEWYEGYSDAPTARHVLRKEIESPWPTIPRPGDDIELDAEAGWGETVQHVIFGLDGSISLRLSAVYVGAEDTALSLEALAEKGWT